VHTQFPFFVLEEKNDHDKRRKAHDLLQAKFPFSGSKIHFERTIHEAYYPGLSTKVLTSQNEAQVLMGETGKVLLLPQIWLWCLENYVVSACSFPDDVGFYGNLPKSDQVEKVATKVVLKNCESVFILTGAILAGKIFEFASPADSEQPSILDLYQRAVFRILSDVTAYIDEPDDKAPNLSQERNFLKRTTQLRGEFAMMLEITSQQCKIVDGLLQLTGVYDSKECVFQDGTLKDDDPVSLSYYRYRGEWELILRARQVLQKCRDRVEKMDRDAERIEASIKDQLELKRTHASMNDARSSLVLGVAVAGFTIVTIIFTPLSFMTSLLALPIDKFSAEQYSFAPNKTDNTTVRAYHSGDVGAWFSKF
jgi:hypothetical protein